MQEKGDLHSLCKRSFSPSFLSWTNHLRASERRNLNDTCPCSLMVTRRIGYWKIPVFHWDPPFSREEWIHEGERERQVRLENLLWRGFGPLELCEDLLQNLLQLFPFSTFQIIYDANIYDPLSNKGFRILSILQKLRKLNFF